MFTQGKKGKPRMNEGSRTEGSAPIRIGYAQSLARLPGPNGRRFASVLADANVEVEIYAPRGVDLQRPHRRDELYLVMTGTGLFRCGPETERFGPGDLLLAPAGVVHRFEDFTDDLVVWVVFYGPEK
jgi:mannose-6-phosphate isomerase-like protein (cupin superfamily)